MSSALPTFIITLREGVEAALVVGIVLAYLHKAKQSELNSWVYGGIWAGILVSAGIGGLFAGIVHLLSTSSQPTAPFLKEILAGIFSTIAVVMLSWMLIWMTQQAKEMKAEVEGSIANTLAGASPQQAGWGIFTLVFVAVAREGFETVIFIAAKLSQGLAPVLGAIAGIVGATGIGALIFKWGVKINLRRFFQVMGALLLLIVGGLAVSALKHLDVATAIGAQLQTPPAHWCWYHDALVPEPSCNLGSLVWNFHDRLPDDRFPGLALKSLFGYRDRVYLVQLVVYIGFLLTIGGIYFRSLFPQGSAVVSRNS
jgi:high-affinity iron transporter